MQPHKKSQYTPNTSIWRMRRKRGFERKQVAWMLGHKTPDQLARYERGEAEPGFDNAIRLSIIYECALEELLPLKYGCLRNELASKALAAPQHAEASSAALFSRINVCSYEDALRDPTQATAYFPYVRDHVTKLAKHLAGL